MPSSSPNSAPPPDGGGGTAVFLDRDGVINRDSRHYVKTWDEFDFLPGSLAALERLSRAGARLLVVTNQSAINRGLTTRAAVHRIHARMCDAVASRGGMISDVFFCPHRPDEECACRKPRPGLLLTAQHRYGLDLERCVLVGDRASDVACARRAGCGVVLQVTGTATVPSPRWFPAGRPAPDATVPDLAAAVEWIITHKPFVTAHGRHPA